ncbi:hypothetical protein Tco_1075297 [Tanacetum coccineum]
MRSLSLSSISFTRRVRSKNKSITPLRICVRPSECAHHNNRYSHSHPARAISDLTARHTETPQQRTPIYLSTSRHERLSTNPKNAPPRTPLPQTTHSTPHLRSYTHIGVYAAKTYCKRSESQYGYKYQEGSFAALSLSCIHHRIVPHLTTHAKSLKKMREIARSEGRGRGRSGNIGIGGSSNVFVLGNQDANYDDGSRSEGRGGGRSGNINIGGSSNVSVLGNQDANFDDGSRSGGRGRGRSGNIIIGGSSNVSGLSNKNADYHDGSRSGGRGRGKSGNIGIGGSSNVSRFGNQDADYDYDNGSISRGKGRSGNIGGRGSSSTSGCGNPNADYDNGTHCDANDNEVETSQHVHELLGACRREASLKATEDNIKVGNDLYVLKPYTQSWIDQSDWEDMIDRVWNTSRWKKKSAIARQNRISEEKQKQRPVSLLEAYQYTHTQETAEALGQMRR